MVINITDIQFDDYDPSLLHVNFHIGMNHGSASGTLKIQYTGGANLKNDVRKKVIEYLKSNISELEYNMN